MNCDHQHEQEVKLTYFRIRELDDAMAARLKAITILHTLVYGTVLLLIGLLVYCLVNSMWWPSAFFGLFMLANLWLEIHLSYVRHRYTEICFHLKAPFLREPFF